MLLGICLLGKFGQPNSVLAEPKRWCPHSINMLGLTASVMQARVKQRSILCRRLDLRARAHNRLQVTDIMLGRTPKLDIASLQSKMISRGRGGYCLEQNMLFREGLRSLGYNITSLRGESCAAWRSTRRAPAIHMLLRRTCLEGPYLADVGFGDLAPTSALLLREGIEPRRRHDDAVYRCGRS